MQPSHQHDEPRYKRRHLLRTAAAGSAAALAYPAIAQPADAAVPLKPAPYPATAFMQTSEAGALHAMYGKTAQPSSNVKLTAPNIAENGAVVPVTVDANLPNVTSVSILTADNPFSMAASYKIPPGTSPTISSRIKLAKTTKIMAIVESDGKLYSTSNRVKVTLGGCG